ncbi:MAG: chromosomal replication initiator protein DnaA [Bacteroidales bacterium]|nr:chromosomal replication initiator protein DnaA [Clostridium sp.]MCM1204274.1 chromosomal replication initiator protein DnaA [Bacteroidales bacterium]
MRETLIEQWDNIMNLLETEYDVSHMMINTWIRSLSIKEVTDTRIVFVMDKKLGKRGIEFIEKKMYDIYLQSAIEATLNQPFEIFFCVEGEELSSDIGNSADTLDGHIKVSLEKSNLNPKYTFDTFVIGDNNRHAHAACVAVAEAPSSAYNPLFVYGGAGLGKTHLMQAIAHHIITHNSDLKVLYVSSEIFTNEVIDSIRNNKAEELRAKYRNLDVLLIDDIQFIIGKDSTQTEFFNTFNDLYNSNRQIIISSDKPPKEIETLEERLRTRLEWGVPVDIHAPDYETRMAILKRKAEMDNIVIADDILDYIAQNVVSNIRELEGALNKISVYTRLENRKGPLTVEEAEDILKDLISKNTTKEITPDLIINIVSDHMNIPYDDITSSKRSQDIATARQIVMFLCRKYLERYSLQQIGAAVGGRDHSTVLNGIDKIAGLIEKDANMKNVIETIEKKLNVN